MSDSPSAKTAEDVRIAAADASRILARVLADTIGIRRALDTTLDLRDRQVLSSIELVMLTQHDVAVLCADLATHTTSMRGHLYARLLLITVFESAKTLRKALDHQFRARVVSITGIADFDEQIARAHSVVCALYRDLQRSHGRVRDGILAHRDADAETRASLLIQVQEESVLKFALELLEVHTLVLPAIAAYTKCFGTSHVAARIDEVQVAASQITIPHR